MKNINKEHLISYINSLYNSINNSTETTVNSIEDVHRYLNDNGIFLDIFHEDYKNEVNWLWRIISLNTNFCTGLYGDNGEFKSEEISLICGISRALELLLDRLTFDSVDKINCKFDLNLTENTTVLEMINLIENYIPTSKLLFFSKIDTDWYKFSRKSSKEFLTYINNKINRVLLGV